jgi:hypothetical protein
VFVCQVLASEPANKLMFCALSPASYQGVNRIQEVREGEGDDWVRGSGGRGAGGGGG